MCLSIPFSLFQSASLGGVPLSVPKRVYDSRYDWRVPDRRSPSTSARRRWRRSARGVQTDRTGRWMFKGVNSRRSWTRIILDMGVQYRLPYLVYRFFRQTIRWKCYREVCFFLNVSFPRHSMILHVCHVCLHCGGATGGSM